MSTRYEDITRQCEHEERTRADLRRALSGLAEVAKRAAKGLETLEAVYGSTNAVKRAEEAHDLAVLDVATARGEDA